MENQEKNYSHIRIHYDYTYEEESFFQPSDDWDSPDKYHYYNLDGTFSVVDTYDEYSYYDLTVPFEIDEDKTYYLLYVEYGSGDSFHHSSGHVEFVHLFDDLEHAMECAKLIGERDEKPNYKRSKSLKLPIGHNKELIPIYCPWEGYFEHITNIEIESVHYIPKKVKISY